MSMFMSNMENPQPHAVCLPLPAQGHMNPMLKLAKLLHLNGFHITFVITEFNFQRLLMKPEGEGFHKDLRGFQFKTISDGLPPSNQRGILDLPALCKTMPVAALVSFRDLVAELGSSSDIPSISCIISDGVMGFSLKVAQEFDIPEFMLFTPSACGMLGYLNFEELVKRGHFPLKDDSCLTSGYLDTQVDWIPAMKGIRLKDLPTFFRTTNPHDTMFNYNLDSVNNATKASGIILNTFDDLEAEVLDAIRIKYPKLYTVGPLESMLHQQQQLLPSSTYGDQMDAIELNLWKEDAECLRWLDKREKGSVVYVNFGSLITMNSNQLSELAWGLVNSRYHFLWVIRPNLVDGGGDVISNHFLKEIEGRGLLLQWCPQVKVLSHTSIGGFLTHCGWNSTLESICEGVPTICLPFFAEQQTNCFYSCNVWNTGMEIDSDVKRENVEDLVRGLMEGKRGRQMREEAMEWKKKALAAVAKGGSSSTNFDKLVSVILKREAQL